MHADPDELADTGLHEIIEKMSATPANLAKTVPELHYLPDTPIIIHLVDRLSLYQKCRNNPQVQSLLTLADSKLVTNGQPNVVVHELYVERPEYKMDYLLPPYETIHGTSRRLTQRNT